MPLYEFKCARCARVFIASEAEPQRSGPVRCPICHSANVTRLASVYSSVDLSNEPTEDETGERTIELEE